ncbi:MAG: phospholipase D-like domain-containing protein [Vulcanimicrobiaceae bacterium]
MRLSVVREALGTPTLRSFRRLIAQLCLAQDDSEILCATRLESILGQYTDRVRSNELFAVLIGFGVLKPAAEAGAYCLAYDKIASLEGALMFADSEGTTRDNTWLPVATIPDQETRAVLSGTILQTAGVIFSLIEQAQRELWIATPFLDSPSVEFLRGPITAAIDRGVCIRILTAECNVNLVDALVDPISASEDALRIWYADAAISDLGSHAKAVVADRRSAYLGSANLTSYGLAKHFELGAALEGPAVSVLVDLFETFAASGRLRTRVRGASSQPGMRNSLKLARFRGHFPLSGERSIHGQKSYPEAGPLPWTFSA